MPNDKPFLILKTGSLTPLSQGFAERFGDTEDTFLTGAGLAREAAHVIDVQMGEPLPEDRRPYAGVMISGSADMVSAQADWMRTTGAWLRETMEQDVPVLAICFGHQLLAHALGGKVGPNPKGLEGGTVTIDLAAEGDPLFGAMPARADLQAHHYETVLVPPPGSEILASSDRDRHQVLRHAPLAWGVQFHPELTMPMMEELMDALATGDDAHDHRRMRDTLRPSPEGPALLQRFVALARDRHR